MDDYNRRSISAVQIARLTVLDMPDFKMLGFFLPSSIACQFATFHTPTSYVEYTVLVLVDLPVPLHPEHGSHLFIFDILVEMPFCNLSFVLAFPLI